MSIKYLLILNSIGRIVSKIQLNIFANGNYLVLQISTGIVAIVAIPPANRLLAKWQYILSFIYSIKT